MVIKKVSKAGKTQPAKKTENKTKLKETKTKKVVTSVKKDTKKVCKIKTTAVHVLQKVKENKNKVLYIVLILALLGFAPMYCFVSEKIAKTYEDSEGYKRAVFGWLKVVMAKKPNEKIKLEGETLTAYNAIKEYAIKIAYVYPSLRNLQIKAHILTPVNSEEAIKTYKAIIKRSGKYSWCPVCKGLLIDKKEKENYGYYFEIAKLYAKMQNKEEATKYIDISIEKFKKDEKYSLNKIGETKNKAILDSLTKKQSEIKKMSIEIKTKKETDKKTEMKDKSKK